MCTNSIFRSMHQARKCWLVSSGLLSQRIACGTPRSVTILSNTRVRVDREAGVHFQCQALPRIRVHHAQHPDRSPALHRVMHEVQCPFLIPCGAGS